MRKHNGKYSKKDQVIYDQISKLISKGEEVDYISIAEKQDVKVMRVFSIVKQHKMEHIIPSYNMELE